VIAISQSTARDLAATLNIPVNKIDLALPGYDSQHYKPLPAADIAAFRAVRQLPPRFWLFLGTLEPRKNLPTLLEAYAALSPAERLPLILAGGKGWDYDAIFSTINRYNLGEAVTLPGYLPMDELPLWYNAAEAFIYPSVFEGFGLPVLEALACGTPVIASDASSLPEVVGDAGLSVTPHSVSAWTAALQRAATDDSWRADARERGVERAAHFRWQNTAQATIASYHRALNQ
jgi:glycosyltransferase involved in cell wall biosynthesis